MSLGFDEAVESPAAASSPSRGSWIVFGLIALTVALLAGGLVTWTHLASSYRSDLSVSLVRPPECLGGTVQQRPVGSDGVPAMDVISARPGLSCTLTVRYANSSPVTLHLGSASYPYLGRGSELLVRMYGAGVTSPREGHYVGGGIVYSSDAHAPLERDLAAGESFTNTYTLRFNRKGCSAGTAWVQGMPEVEVSALGLTGTINGSIAIAVKGTYDGCSR